MSKTGDGGSRTRMALALLGLLGWVSATAWAQPKPRPDTTGPRPDVLAPPFEPVDVIRVYESTFEQLAAAIEPIEFKSPENGPRYSVLGCSGNWRAKVTHIEFDITPERVAVDGKINATWTCGASFDFSGSFSTTADVRYSAILRAIRVDVQSVSVQLKWDVRFIGSLFKVRRTIDAGEGLRVPPIPIGDTSFDFETARGPEKLRLRPRNVVVVKGNGYIGVQGAVSLY